MSEGSRWQARLNGSLETVNKVKRKPQMTSEVEWEKAGLSGGDSKQKEAYLFTAYLVALATARP